MIEIFITRMLFVYFLGTRIISTINNRNGVRYNINKIILSLGISIFICGIIITMIEKIYHPGLAYVVIPLCSLFSGAAALKIFKLKKSSILDCFYYNT
ncbi:MAG: hypothetical protein ACOC5R_00745, partial [Elusimicrobiota bacterium]